MRRALLYLGVLILGVSHVELRGLDASGEKTWWFKVNGSLALLIYAVTVIVLLFRVLDQMPGVFGLRRALGTVRSEYHYLWVPGLVSGIMGFTFNWDWHDAKGVGAGEAEFRYGLLMGGDAVSVAAFGAFILLMIVLRFRAAMSEANRRLDVPANA